MQAWFQKRSLIWLGLSIIVAGIWLRNQNAEDEQAAPQTAPPLLIVKQGVSYIYDEQGKTNTILRSPLTHHYQDQRGTHFQSPTLDYQQGDSQTHIRANQAVQNQARTELNLSGEVFAQRQIGQDPSTKTDFSSEQMLYRLEQNQAETDLPVQIRTADSTTHAIGTIWHLNQNLFILKQNVRSYYAPHHNL